MLKNAVRLCAGIAVAWSLMVMTGIAAMAAAFSLTDRFNGPKGNIVAGMALMEAALLALLMAAYRLSTGAAAGLAAWLAVAAVLVDHAHGIAAWFDTLLAAAVLFAPVTLTAALLAATRWRRDR